VKDRRRATLYGLGAVLAWSTVATAFKLALRELDTYQLLLVATAVSLACLSAVLTVQRRLSDVFAVAAGDRLRALALGAMNPFVYYLVLFAAYDRLPAQVAQPINFTWALTLAWLSIPLLGQKPRRRDLGAGVVCYAGVFLIATGGDVSSFRVADPLGVGLALLSTVLWALYWIANTRSRLDPVVGLWWNFAGALPLILVATLVMSDLRLPTRGAAIAAYVGAFEMGFTFVLWLTALRLAPVAAQVANLIFLAPFLSLLLIHHVLGEHVLPATFIGLVLIVGGLAWQGSSDRPTSRSSADAPSPPASD
jgi:drug/metabolite transporter (DMT)-like permease